jgi:hypothetical protein
LVEGVGFEGVGLEALVEGVGLKALVLKALV